MPICHRLAMFVDYLGWRLAIASLVLAFSPAVTMAADISLDQADGIISISGPIVAGDAEKLVGIVLSQGPATLQIRTVWLNSPGGSIDEAVRLAALIQRLRLTTTVPGKRRSSPDEKICASACFIVWLGGYSRHASGHLVVAATDGSDVKDLAKLLQESAGKVGLHRPFIKLDEVSKPDTLTAQAQQRQAMNSVREYLMDRSVPAELITKMMSRSSREIYWVGLDEMTDLNYSPEHQELLAANCGFQGPLRPGATREQLDAFVESMSAAQMKRSSECERALMLRIRTRELPDLLSELRKGTRSWK